MSFLRAELLTWNLSIDGLEKSILLVINKSFAKESKQIPDSPSGQTAPSRDILIWDYFVCTCFSCLNNLVLALRELITLCLLRKNTSENIVCCSRLLHANVYVKLFGHIEKQRGPLSDCS